MNKIFQYVLIVTLIVFAACSKEYPQLNDLMSFPIKSLEGVIDQSNIIFDSERSSDRNGSLRIEATEPLTVRLYETGDIDAEDCRLVYTAKILTENLNGRAYLEMWCVFDSLGEFFGRDLQTPVTGSDKWSPEEVFFLLQKSQNPSNVKLNLIIDGTGTVWIDDIHLIKAPLLQGP